jgi:fatty-acyl-CoA synthase
MGVIGTRGPHIMLGYWTRGVSSKQALYNEWMFTNDLGYIHPNSGKLYFCGRANDAIRTGGESVLATEVEKIIELHPEIIECAVFGLPDEKFGEAICAAVVFKASVLVDGVDLLESDEVKEKLREHCAKHQLAGFKRPRRAFCMHSLPRNSSGKVLKRQISWLCSRQLNVSRSRL